MFALLVLLVLWVSPAPVHADSPATFQPVIKDQYSGGYPNDYADELQRLPGLISTAQQEIPPQLGYGQQFNHPITIRFVDGGPAYADNPYFSLAPHGSGDSYSQDLMANVEAFANAKNDDALRAGYYYAFTQAVLNDQTAGNEDRSLPLWVLEGVSVYFSGSGDAMVAKADDLTYDLNLTYPYLTRKQRASYYLAIKYISRAGVVNLQTFLKDLLSGQSPPDAVTNVLGYPWAEFAQDEKTYAMDSLNRSHYHPPAEDASKKKHSLFDDPPAFPPPGTHPPSISTPTDLSNN